MKRRVTSSRSPSTLAQWMRDHPKLEKALLDLLTDPKYRRRKPKNRKP